MVVLSLLFLSGLLVQASNKVLTSECRKENLMAEILRLQYMDPDIIFTAEKSCSLNDVFGTKGSKKRPDFVRRGSSGNWLSDSLTSREETEYKVSMGYTLPAKIH
jgi:hypothetical protein